MGLSVGLPRIHQERGERRDFLPELVGFLEGMGASEVVLEHGYGAGVGRSPSDYLARSSVARIGTYEEALTQDVVILLRCPAPDALRQLRPGAILVSMLHYPSRPERVAFLLRLGVRAVSMDSIVDESGRRLIENMRATGWNGVRAAFREIRRMHPRFAHPSRRPLRVTCLGSGAVGGHAVRAATHYGDPGLRDEMAAKNVPGVEVTVVDFDLTRHDDYMLSRLELTDLLIDATRRVDPSRHIIPNEWLAALSQDAVILDLAADPYDFETDPPKVKGIEGIPHGNLDRYVFPVSDPAYEELDPRIDATQRRLALSCYSWPGLDPEESMRTYGDQCEPALRVVFEKPMEEWDPEHGSSYERAVARAEVSRWSQAHIH